MKILKELAPVILLTIIVIYWTTLVISDNLKPKSKCEGWEEVIIQTYSAGWSHGYKSAINDSTCYEELKKQDSLAFMTFVYKICETNESNKTTH